MSEEIIIRHYSPTLAVIKVGNLFNCNFECENILARRLLHHRQN